MIFGWLACESPMATVHMSPARFAHL
jgi:hypothetical protein